MKKAIVIIIAALALSAPRALAQDMFNHLAVGISVGIDGLGLEAATPLGDHFQLRGGYSLVPFTYNRNINFGTANVGNKPRNMDNVPLQAKLWKGGLGNILADWYPGEGSFHVTAGVFVGGNFASADADLRKSLDAAEYGTLGIGFEGGPAFTTDSKGFAHVDFKVLPVMPYVGIGAGRAISEGRVTFTLDFGALVTGGIKPQSYNYIRNSLNPSNPVEVISINSKAVNNRDKGWIDKISGIPVFPLLKFNVFVKLF